MSQVIAYSDDSQGPINVSQGDPLPVYVAEAWATIPVSLKAPSAAPLNANSLAYEASRIVKAGPGTLYGLTGYNSKGTAQFILIFDSATLPADGAIPKVILTAATVANFASDFGVYGMAFSAGIVVCNSSTGPTKTIGSADSWFAARYA